MQISDDDIWTLERRFWLDGEAAYREHMASTAVMVFPDPPGIIAGEDILASLADAPRWSDVEFEDGRLVRANDAMLVATYRAVAKRGSEIYRAMCSPSYGAIDGKWTLIHHHQTPVDETAR